MIKRVIAIVVGALLIILWIAWLRVLGGYGSFTNALLETLSCICFILSPVIGGWLIVYGFWGDDN